MLERLEEVLREHPQAAWAGSSFWWGRRLFQGRPFSAETLRSQTTSTHRAHSTLEAFPGFDESLKRFQDWGSLAYHE